MKMKEKNKTKKLPYNVLRKGVVAGILGLALGLGAFGLTGCSLNGEDGLNGKDGSQWYSGTTNIELVTTGNNGDFYYDTDDYKLYQKENGSWVLKVENFGKPGTNGTNGINGLTPTITINDDGYWVINGEVSSVKAKGETGANGNDGQDGQTPTITINGDGYWVINGTPTDVKAKGDKGDKGDTGATGSNGSNVFIGYDGYIWQDGLKTEFKIEKDATLTENVVEDTIGAYTTMQYFAGNYVDLTTNRIALMANYKPNAKLTQYSGTKITEIQVVAESAGTLHIGTAKVSDIVNARTNGSTYTATTTSHTLVAGINTITFSTPLEVDEDETIVIGGSNSTAKVYVANNIPVSDEEGNFTLLNGLSNASVISKTGNHADTLAVRVKLSTTTKNVALFPEITADFDSDFTNTSKYGEVLSGGGPFKYNTAGDLKGKTITRLGVAVSSVVGGGTSGHITVYKFDASKTKNFSTGATAIRVDFNNIVAGNWAYADCNIELGANETIAFGATSGDTINWVYTKTNIDSKYNFINNDGTVGALTPSNPLNIAFDIYYAEDFSFEKHIEELNKKENAAIKKLQEQALKNELQGKKFSILGDSISTYTGYSNDNTNTNSTIGSNSVEYNGTAHGVTSVDQTWWKQTADLTGMNILVNNSYAGDQVTNYGQTRCENLHDNTGANAGTNPDIIAVYLGTNDFNGYKIGTGYTTPITPEAFRTGYESMVAKMKSAYGDAKICVFTILPNNKGTNTAENLVQYNNIIREIASENNLVLVDLYANSGITARNCSEYMGDSIALHPNQAGMDKISDCFWNALYENYVTNAD